MNRKALTLAATALALLATLGAESSACKASTTTPDGVKVRGGADTGPCSTRISQPYVNAGQVTAYADMTCTKAVQNATLTVLLDKRDTSGVWHTIGKNTNSRSPGINQTMKVTVTGSCSAGYWRTRSHAYVEPVQGGESATNNVDAESPTGTVSKEQC